jgi:hypothetical protein
VLSAFSALARSTAAATSGPREAGRVWAGATTTREVDIVGFRYFREEDLSEVNTIN